MNGVAFINTHKVSDLFLFDGQSLNNVVYGYGVAENSRRWVYPYWAMLDQPGVPWAKIARSGQSVTALAPTQAERYKRWIVKGGPRVHLMYNGGTSDYSAEHDTGLTMYGQLGAYANEARNLGVTTFNVTTVPGAGNITDTDETQRVIGNGLIMNDANLNQYFDFVSDIAQSPMDVGVINEWFIDSVHFTLQAGQLVGARVRPTIAAILSQQQ